MVPEPRRSVLSLSAERRCDGLRALALEVAAELVDDVLRDLIAGLQDAGAVGAPVVRGLVAEPRGQREVPLQLPLVRARYGRERLVADDCLDVVLDCIRSIRRVPDDDLTVLEVVDELLGRERGRVEVGLGGVGVVRAVRRWAGVVGLVLRAVGDVLARGRRKLPDAA